MSNYDDTIGWYSENITESAARKRRIMAENVHPNRKGNSLPGYKEGDSATVRSVAAISSSDKDAAT